MAKYLLTVIAITITVLISLKLIKCFRDSKLKVLHFFLLGMLLTQVLPYIVFYSSEGVDYYNKHVKALLLDISDISLLFVLLCVCIVLFSYMIFYKYSNSIVLHFSQIRFRQGHLVKKTVLIACWVISVSFFFISLYFLLDIICHHSAEINNTLFRDKIASLGPWQNLKGVSLALIVVTFNEYLLTKEGLKKFIIASILGLPFFIIQGQRSALITPLILIVLLYYKRKGKFNFFVLAALSISVFVLVWYTLYYKVGLWSNEPSDLLLQFVGRDFDTLWTLFYALDGSLRSKSILPYFGQGYVNALLAFLPRSICPMKGYRGSLWFTEYVAQIEGLPLGAASIADMNWSFKISFITEAVLNFNIVGALCVLCVYGVVLSIFDSVARRLPVLYAPLCLLAFSFWWSDLFTILIGIGFIAFIIFVIDCQQDTG